MKRLLQQALFFVGLLLLFSSCEEEQVTFLPSGASAFPSSEYVEASFYGRLLDQELSPVIEAEVWIGDRMVLSDSLGDWIIPKVEVISRRAYIKVEAQGYFSASRVLSVSPGSMNSVRIMPTKKLAYSIVQSAAGGAVQLPDGSSLTFQPGSFVLASSGAQFDGEVHVYAYSIDGRSESSQVQMPGRLESTTEEATLISFGMVATELETPSGEKLQLKEGLPATVRYEQVQLDANAPDTIPLWHFDEAIGTWVKEGFSVREGNAYVGEVAHFTWWNCDWPLDLVDFCIQFTCADTIASLVGRQTDNPTYCMSAFFETGEDRRSTRFVGLDGNLRFCDVLPANAQVTFNFLGVNGNTVSVGPFNTGEDDIDFGVHPLDCSALSTDCFSYDPPPPTPTTPPLPPPPVMVTSTLTWSAAECENAAVPFMVRVASTERNSTPFIIDGQSLSMNSITLSLPEGKRIILSMLDPNTGEVLGQGSYYPHPQVDIGSLNPATGIIDATGYFVKGRILDCDGGMDNVSVRLLSLNGSVVDETRSSPAGRFTLNTSECDGRGVVVSILTAEGEQVIETDLYSGLQLDDIEICAANGNYYWRAKVNGRQFSYLTANGRAGNSGWVAYAANEPDPDAPFFGLDHSNGITAASNYLVGPDERIQFNGFRLGQYNFSPSTHPFEGRLEVSEYGSVAAGVFTGTCIDPDGETIVLEVEMRFVKP